MTRHDIALLLAAALRAATLAAAEPDGTRAGELVDAGIDAMLRAQAGAAGTEQEGAVEREAMAIAAELAAVAAYHAQMRQPA